MFIQQALLVLMIFIGFRLFMGQNAPPTNTKTPDEILKDLRTDDAAVKDLTAASDFRTLLTTLSNSKLSQQDQDAKELEGAIILADTQDKAGILWNDLRRLNSAYTGLQKYESQWQQKPFWNNRVAVEAPTAGPVPEVHNPTVPNTWTAQEIYDQTVTVLDQKNRDTLVWGIFPGYQLIDFLVHATGAQPAFSYWFAAILLAVALRAILFPLSQKQMMYSRQMQQLNPLLKDLKEKYKDNAAEYGQKQMALFKEYGINPAAGCLPMLIQMPLVYLVYSCMLHYRFEFQKGIFLWVNPVAHAWWIRVGHGRLQDLIAANLGQKDLILLTIYAVSMVATSLMMPVPDPSNPKQGKLTQLAMSGVFAIMMFWYPALPSGFVLYWAATNVLTTIQFFLIYRRPMVPLVKVNTKDGGVYPTDGSNGSGNGKFKNPFAMSPEGVKTGAIKTGTPAKHKPKKRK